MSNPFRFAGYYSDGDTSLYHVGDRYMDPSSGAAPWLQRDPISNPSNPSSWNHHVYAGDDSVNFTDPTGRQGCVPAEALVAPFGIALGSPLSFGLSAV